MTKYVCGFCFNENLTRIALIEKKKPKWQEGLLNGIGGKIEEGETPEQAMIREFKEEAGIDTEQWSPFVTISGEGWRVYFFYYIEKEIFDYIRTQEDEGIFLLDVDGVFDNYACIKNLEWLIPMAIYKHKNPDDKFSFNQLATRLPV